MFQYSLLLLLIIILIVLREMNVRRVKSSKTKKSTLTIGQRRFLAYFFVGSAILSLYTLWIFLLNAGVGILIAAPVSLILLTITASSASTVIKNLYFSKALLITAIVIASVSILLTGLVFVLALQHGRLFLHLG